VRLGLFGGSFDPPHVGHLLLASDARESLALDRVVFIPVCQQPLKVGRTLAPPAARLRMLLDTVDADPRFEVDSTEIDRGGLSYTVDTLRVYAERHPHAERFFFMGADSLQSLESWREPARVVSLAHLAILARAGTSEAMPTEGMLRERARALAGVEALEPVVVAVRRVDISSTEIRARVRAGTSIRGFVVDAVSRYIEDSGLYR
jgi:nicotinate-nucleotide adenylyltransferase